ncbi:hypothetical protein Rhal01_00249 [Rubritalea halochordaticola]|uniref:Thiamine biosynthesis protein ThiF n=1 Tax=Rubritalea halochordaticola TaxID=714537 RepID=A0ABP9UUH0_9BACT
MPRSLFANQFHDYLVHASTLFHFNILELITDDPEYDIFTLRLELDLPSQPRVDIHKSEEVSIFFDVHDEVEPKVKIVRKDFPLIAHVNPLHDKGESKVICLYDSPWQDRRLVWNAAEFFERIYMWLQDAAKGILHRPDQPLEPFLTGSTLNALLPKFILEAISGTSGKVSEYYFKKTGNSDLIFWIPAAKDDAVAVKANILTIKSKPKVHGHIKSLPLNLFELSELLDEGLEEIVSLVSDNVKSATPEDDGILLLYIEFPLKRSEKEEVELIDRRLFIFGNSLYEVGDKLGVFSSHGEYVVPIVGEKTSISDEVLQKIPILPMTIIEDLSRDKAQQYGGIEEGNCKTMLIGCGALGSQVHMNLVRVGFGQWCVVDHDHLLPHNLVRHSANSIFLGYSKSYITATQSSYITWDHGTRHLVCDILKDAGINDKLTSEYEHAEFIFDCSASTAVARHLALDVDCDARRASSFIGAGLNSLFFVGEDKGRHSRLDWLEMLVYREALYSDSVSKALANNITKVPYGITCRDISVQLPQDIVAIMAGISSKVFRKYTNTSNALALAYCIEDDDSISCTHIKPTNPIFNRNGGWDIVYDDYLIDKLSSLRQERLPSETGGILVGSHDMLRKIIYIVDALPAPADSVESPASFIRGVKDLKAATNDIRSRTSDSLHYVGDWHSHPKGCSPQPSPTDHLALTEFQKRARLAAIPVTMLIVGDDGKHTINVTS